MDGNIGNRRLVYCMYMVGEGGWRMGIVGCGRWKVGEVYVF